MQNCFYCYYYFLNQETQLNFDLPNSKIPEFYFHFDPLFWKQFDVFSDYIYYIIKIINYESKPEPPWIKREDENIIFTDEIEDLPHLNFDESEFGNGE